MGRPIFIGLLLYSILYMVKIKSGDLLLLLLYQKGVKEKINEPIQGRTKLVKAIFLFEKEYHTNFINGDTNAFEVILPDFFAWKFGPMSTDVLSDLEFFVNINFIKCVEIKSPCDYEEADELISLRDDYSLDNTSEEEYTECSYELSGVGVSYVEEKILPLVNENQLSLIEDLKKRINRATLKEVLDYTYSKYPEYAEKSIIKDKICHKEVL